MSREKETRGGLERNKRLWRQLARRIRMGPVEELNPAHCGDLRASYKQAFAIWAREASRLQARVADPAASAAEVENARRLAEKAHVVYRESRDLLWECMTG